ncbi:MAG: 2-hydroxyacid dehydrogenase [Mucilaginibacter sp.]|nr:2-hydroxyacid dehydrogenase [Mucilaginibacter sp.]
MKAVAYSIKPFEREFLAKANQKKHDITLISNALSPDTAVYAEGKEAVIVSTNDGVSAFVIEKLAALGIKYIATRSVGTNHIDKESAASHCIKLANVPYYPPQAIAEHAVALAFALNRQLPKADRHAHHFDFRNDDLIGFNFTGKTVGIIGLGDTGKAAAQLFSGLGCRVVGYDQFFPEDLKGVTSETLPDLLAQSDIISLHLPLTASTTHLINKGTIGMMKDGVMLINTSGAAVIKTTDVRDALKTGKIGYLGLDAYEFEEGLFFESHEDDLVKDELLKELMKHPNVLITPHQAYLTKEALQEISNQTIKSLDQWQTSKCLGDACVCTKDCRQNP